MLLFWFSFFILQLSAQSQMKKVEFWIDKNFSQRIQQTFTATKNLSWENLIALDTVSNGVHTFQIRFSDKNNVWTNVQSHFFLKDWNESGIAQVRKVSKYQYWIDQNSAQRVKRTLSSVDRFSWEELVALAFLSNGVHTFSCAIFRR